MNQGYTNNSNYIQGQSTYPPYMNIPNYNSSNINSTTVNTLSTADPQYAESIFEINKGKKVTVYFSYPDSVEWRDKVFTGTIITAGRDYLLLKDESGQINLLWLVYINYATFDDEISY